MNFDYEIIQAEADRRTSDLKRFQATYSEFKPCIEQLDEVLDKLADLVACYQELDNETQKAVPSEIGVILGMHSLDRDLHRIIGTEEQLGLKHMYKDGE